MKRTVFAPGSIGNVGPGFDVLGLAFDGMGDRVSIELTGWSVEVTVRGRDADRIPCDPLKNVAAIAARHYLAMKSYGDGARIEIEKGLPLSGGMGGSAASSVGGALVAALALGEEFTRDEILRAALEGESAVAGRHLDNIAPSLLGGLVLTISSEPPDVVPLEVAREWWLALVTPQVRIETKFARSVIPDFYERHVAVQQMANTAGVVTAFQTGDGELLSRSLVDLFAEPYRSRLIPHFDQVRHVARESGAFACTISGAGPTLFAVAPDEATARRVAGAMCNEFAEVPSVAHVAQIDRKGAREV